MSTITKKDLVLNVSKAKNLNPIEVKDVVQAILDEIVDQLGKRNRIEFRDFAVFDVRVRPPRIGHNPRTLEKVHVPARAVVEFKMGKRMKEAVQNLEPGTFQPNSPPAPAAPASTEPAPPTA